MSTKAEDAPTWVHVVCALILLLAGYLVVAI